MIDTSVQMEFSRYLGRLPVEQLSVLYESKWTCLAVLRSLPSLSQQMILRLMFVDQPVPDSLLRGFVKDKYLDRCRQNLEQLEQLQIVQKEENNCWSLEPTFRSATDVYADSSQYVVLGAVVQCR